MSEACFFLDYIELEINDRKEAMHVLARATQDGLAGRFVAHGPPAAHPYSKEIFMFCGFFISQTHTVFIHTNFTFLYVSM